MRKILFIMSVFVAFGLTSAMADTSMSCQVDSGCSMENCSSAVYIYDSSSDTCPCSCAGTCLNNTTKTYNNNGSYTCEGAQLQFGSDPCSELMCTCCYAPGRNDLGCGANNNHVITVGCQAAQSGNCTRHHVEMPISEYCASITDGVYYYYCDKGYYGLTANSASGVCTICPDAESVWSDSGHNNPVHKTTTEYLGYGSTENDCCLPELGSGSYYYDTIGKFSNHTN